jgi:hypothetical protein
LMSCLFGEKMKKCHKHLGFMWELWPRCSMMLVYLTTKLGNFGQGQMLVNIPAPWFAYGWGLSGALPIIIVLLSPCRWRCNRHVMGYNQRTMRPKFWRSLVGNTLVLNHGIWDCWDQAAKNGHPVRFDMIWLLLLISWFINPNNYRYIYHKP